MLMLEYDLTVDVDVEPCNPCSNRRGSPSIREADGVCPLSKYSNFDMVTSMIVG